MIAATSTSLAQEGGQKTRDSERRSTRIYPHDSILTNSIDENEWKNNAAGLVHEPSSVAALVGLPVWHVWDKPHHLRVISMSMENLYIG